MESYWRVTWLYCGGGPYNWLCPLYRSGCRSLMTRASGIDSSLKRGVRLWWRRLEFWRWTWCLLCDGSLWGWEHGDDDGNEGRPTDWYNCNKIPIIDNKHQMTDRTMSILKYYQLVNACKWCILNNIYIQTENMY